MKLYHQRENRSTEASFFSFFFFSFHVLLMLLLLSSSAGSKRLQQCWRPKRNTTCLRHETCVELTGEECSFTAQPEQKEQNKRREKSWKEWRFGDGGFF